MWSTIHHRYLLVLIHLYGTFAHLDFGAFITFCTLSCNAFQCSLFEVYSLYISCFQRQFLNAGKHVLVEYPMALSWTAAQDLWELAEQKGDVCSICLEHSPCFWVTVLRILWYLYSFIVYPHIIYITDTKGSQHSPPHYCRHIKGICGGPTGQRDGWEFTNFFWDLSAFFFTLIKIWISFHLW